MISAFIPVLPLPFMELRWPDITADQLRMIVVVVGFFGFLCLEARFRHKVVPAKIFRQSYVTNAGTFFLNELLMSLLSTATLLAVAQHYRGWGLLHQLDSPALKAVIAFLLLDLTLYFWHRANHQYACLWMFHKVHHSDLSMNASTAFRLHSVEVLLTTLIKAVFIVILGVEMETVLIAETLTILFVMFHHADLSFPGEQRLSKVITVPCLHRVHHSTRREEHDRNYGAIFSIWDQAFGTLAVKQPAQLGLKDVPPLNVWQLWRFGLTSNYSASLLQPAVADSHSLGAMIAEAAYYRAQNRGFSPGSEFADWFEAEKEIKDRFR